MNNGAAYVFLSAYVVKIQRKSAQSAGNSKFLRGSLCNPLKGEN